METRNRILGSRPGSVAMRRIYPEFANQHEASVVDKQAVGRAEADNIGPDDDPGAGKEPGSFVMQRRAGNSRQTCYLLDGTAARADDDEIVRYPEGVLQRNHPGAWHRSSSPDR